MDIESTNYANSKIPYTPPHADASDYAARALGHLRTLERFDPRLLAYMLAPSNVLAFAGLRSFSPYNDRFTFDVDVPRLDTLLASYGFLWLDEQPNITNPTLASYALVNFDVADHLHDTYPLDALSATGPVRERSDWGFFGWQAGLDIALARTIECDTLPREWLTDWWSPHNIRFGMLLGYPGAAIASFVQAEVSEKHRTDMEEIMVSGGLFNSATVAFAAAKAYRDREDVVTMVETWRATLSAVYTEYSPEKLMSDSEFAATVRAKN